MGTGMTHGMLANLPRTFALVVILIDALFFAHILLTLWRKQSTLFKLKEGHSTLVHSVPMSLGMVSTMSVCIVIGGLMRTEISAAYIWGTIVAILMSGFIAIPFKDDIAVLDGVISGAMGGLMGIMAGVMIPLPGLYTLCVLLALLFTVTWFVMNRRIILSQKS